MGRVITSLVPLWDPLMRQSRISACLVAALGILLPAKVSRVSLLVDYFITCPSGDGEMGSPVPRTLLNDVLIASVLPTANAWNRKELGFVRLAGWEAPGALLMESLV